MNAIDQLNHNCQTIDDYNPESYLRACVGMMDDSLREELHMSAESRKAMRGMSEQIAEIKFLELYCARHAEQFGADFVVS